MDRSDGGRDLSGFVGRTSGGAGADIAEWTLFGAVARRRLKRAKPIEERGRATLNVRFAGSLEGVEAFLGMGLDLRG